MISLKGVYENQEQDIDLFDDLVGIINIRLDGSVKHDQYVSEEIK